MQQITQTTTPTTIEQRIELYQLVETSLNQMFSELSFCKDRCIPRDRSYMGNSHKNGAIGCCHQNFYRLHIPLYKDIDQETATNIKHRFRKLQEENLITRLLEPNSEVKDYLNDNYRTLKKCSSHSKEGCMIAKFKSPTCVSYTCVPIERELLNVYNITYDRLIIIDFLDDIIKGKVTLEQANNFNQLTNQATKRIKSFKQDHRINIKEEIIISK